MAPILIDKSSLLKFGFLSMLVTTSVFSAGFLFGYERASTIHQAGVDVEILNLPENVIVAGELEPQTPENIVAGEDIDVDYPDVIVATSQKEVVISKEDIVANHINDALSPVASEHSSVGKKSLKSSDSTEAAGVIAKSPDVILSNKERLDTDARRTVAAASNEKPAVLLSSLTADELNNINYSIQVGTYGRLVNAENMVKMLHARNFDAYISNYNNQKGEIRYNVRMGYFSDKKSAVSVLSQYKNTEKGDGYLVKFSAENIVNLADAENIKLPASRQDEIKNKVNSSSPDVMPDKVSQADIINAPKASKIIATN